MTTRLLIVQYAGDYRETFRHFANGGEETYYAQQYSVDAVADMAKKVDEVATLCCLTQEPYNELVGPGVRALGAGFSQKIHIGKLLRLIQVYAPTHLLLRTPIAAILRWAIQKKVKTLVTLADSFKWQGLPQRLRNYHLAKLLNHNQVDWIGNHGLIASRSLEEIGVQSDKIIPWDWPHVITPNVFSPKTLSSDKTVYQILYVGSIDDSKGIGEVIEAISKLKSQGLSIYLKVAGKGKNDKFINRIKQLQIEKNVEFLGLVANNIIITLMREADLVIVPSRHDSPEGFPMTIYEALCSRTPIIASDHPMFINTLKHEKNALIFPAGNSFALALNIERLLSNAELYYSFSKASFETWQSLQIPVKWSDLVNAWLFDSPENRQWLSENRLASKKYC